VKNPLRDNLMKWLTMQVQQLRLEAVLRAREEQGAPIPDARSRLHLLIMVQPDGIDPDRFLLSYWRQDDPDEWPPARGETDEVALADLELKVDELVLAAERAWSGHGGTVALEFLLPRDLLRLPVHGWHKEHDSGFPRPLCMDYPVVVRSLERMRSEQWHRVWRERWGEMIKRPAMDQVHFCQPADLGKRNRLGAILKSPQWTLAVLTGAPEPEPATTMGEDELTAALRAGIPALIWHPKVSSDGLREIVSWLVEGDGMNDLPVRAQSCRLAAFQELARPYDADLVSDLVILWDDPGRMVALDQPSVLPRL
jgi:NTP-dependent ternary conflict system VMAP-like protein